jgi:hypothetical protein
MPLYASLDIETDGNNPLQHNMLSLGIAMFNRHGALIDTFYQNISPQAGKVADPKCMTNFWNKFPELYKNVCTNRVEPAEAMTLLDKWLKTYSTNITWVASPSCFDWMFLKSYFEAYGPPNRYDLGFSCQCLPSLARGYAMLHNSSVSEVMALLGGIRMSTDVHHALSDAIYQGHCYMNLRHLIEVMTNRK